MRHIVKVNIEQSVNKQKLVFEEEWSDKIDRVAIYIFFSGFIIYPLLLIFKADFSNSNDKFFSLTILPVFVLFGCYVIYRKATEKLLFKIITDFDKQKNREILLDYADKVKLEIHRKSNDLLIFNETIGDFNTSHKKSIVLIIKDNIVFFTILKDQFRLNLPTLTSHIFLKNDLKKILKQSK